MGSACVTVVCGRCGLIFTNPRPNSTWFDEFYLHSYRSLYELVTTPTEEYLSTDRIRGRHKRNLELLAQAIPKTGRVLDVGCAEGTFLGFFRQHLPQWQVYGIEPDESFARFAREHYGLEHVWCGSIVPM